MTLWGLGDTRRVYSTERTTNLNPTMTFHAELRINLSNPNLSREEVSVGVLAIVALKMTVDRRLIVLNGCL